MKKTIALLLTVFLMLGCIPMFSSAAEIVASGDCGENGNNVTWTLDEEGTLTISGTGCMMQYKYDNPAPWYDLTVKNAVIEEGVTNIGEASFVECTGLTSVTIPDSVKTIDDDAFSDCTGLKSVSIPDGVTRIGKCAFYNCISLTSLTIPGSVTSMAGSAFYDCTGLTSLTIREGVTMLGGCAFYGCTGLTSVTIPKSMTFISSNAFANCTGLTNVTIPKSVTKINDYAFSGCSAITDVYYDGSREDWNRISFGWDNESIRTCNVHCHEHNYEAVETVDYTCTEAGYVVYACAACGETYTKVLPAAHRYEKTTVSPTCTMMGYTTYVCSRCGDSYTEVVNATGHLDINADGICDVCRATLTDPGNGGNQSQNQLQQFISIISSFFRNIIDFFRNLFRR